jgi:hypothetical protein
LLGLEVLSDRRELADALFVRDILFGRIESAYLLYHRTNFGQDEPVNKAIFLMHIVTGLVFVMKKVCILFVVASVMLCLESGLGFQ